MACGKTKFHSAVPACDLYRGALFKKSLAYAKTLNPAAIFILSAKHGLLDLHELVAPYELTLNTVSKLGRMRWSEKVLNQLASKSNLHSDEFICLAGEAYISFVRPHLTNCATPLSGLRFGEQLSWLSDRLGAYHGCAD